MREILLLLALQALVFQASGQLLTRHRTLPVRNNMTAKEIQKYELDASFKPKLDFTPTGKDNQPSSAGDFNWKVSGQIIGGATAASMQFPWQAYVGIDDVWLCGGSLIAANWLLTAAHCVYGSSTFVVTVGGVQRTTTERSEVTQTSTKAIYHENYDDYWLTNDVAVIKLPKNFPLNQYVNVIRLPKSSESKKTYASLTVTASGYGMTANEGDASDVMNFVSLKVITNSKCASMYGSETVISSCICTAADTRKSICSGDSGGPLMYKEIDRKFTQVGVVSFGAAESCTNFPSGFARVTSFLGWISKNTGIAIRK